MYLDVVHIYIFIFSKSDEWLQSYDLKCINMYNLDGVGIHWQIFLFSNFFESFQTNMAQNHPQLQISPKKWIRLGQNGQIWLFCMISYLFPQNEAEIDSEWSISPDSQLFPSFATKGSHFWRKLQKILFLGGYISNFCEFSNFFKSFHTNMAQNHPQLKILLVKK